MTGGKDIFLWGGAYIVCMLKVYVPKYYKVKEGQSLKEIARAFCVAERLLVKCNGLKSEPFAGQILVIPNERGNVYTAREGDTMALLCGSEENFARKNGGDVLYLGMRVIL